MGNRLGDGFASGDGCIEPTCREGDGGVADAALIAFGELVKNDATGFLDGDAARDEIMEAFRCEGAVGPAFLPLRLGQVELEMGHRGRAVGEFIRAHERAGDAVFEGEDPKYLAMVRAALDPVN